MNFTDWQATRTHVTDIGAVTGLADFAGRSGLIYAGHLIIEDRAEAARFALAPECAYTVTIGSSERIASDLTTLELELFRDASHHGHAMTPVPVVFDTTVEPVNERECPECAEIIRAKARRCRYCGARVRPLRSTATM